MGRREEDSVTVEMPGTFPDRERNMGQHQPRVRPHTVESEYFYSDAGCQRWREWARCHDRSGEYDGSSTVVQRSWYGRQAQVPAR
jgi:hypothetical protein